MAPTSLHELRKAIPAHCFERSYGLPFYYLFRHLLYLFVLVCLVSHLSNLRSIWINIPIQICSFTIGVVGAGLWILAHECGHGAFSPSQALNDFVGWILHSFLLVPYFSWAITHARHHRFTNHMDKDTAFVPHRVEERATRPFLHFIEDAPLFSTISRIIVYQFLGWPLYLLFNLSAGRDSAPFRTKAWTSSHLDPLSGLFRPRQRFLVLLSDLGLVLVGVILHWARQRFGWFIFIHVYGIPYIWVNFLIVAITYLHHTHPNITHYENGSWSYVKGATSTIDRDFGVIDRHFLFNICGTHVVHHLFPKIPSWHAREATLAITPLLGSHYHESVTPFLIALWRTFKDCAYVEAKQSPDGTGVIRVWKS